MLKRILTIMTAVMMTVGSLEMPVQASEETPSPSPEPAETAQPETTAETVLSTASPEAVNTAETEAADTAEPEETAETTESTASPEASETADPFENKSVNVQAEGFTDDSYQMQAEEILIPETLDQYEKILSDREIVEAFDVTVTEGEIADPETGIAVTLPLDMDEEEELDQEETDLYHIQNFDPSRDDDESNVPEKLDYTYDQENQTITFTAKSFSPFVLVKENEEDQIEEQQEEQTAEQETQEADTDTEESGDETSAAAKMQLAEADSSGITLQSFDCSFAEGADLNDSGDYVWTADTTHPGHPFKYRVNYSLSGKGYLEPESIKIRIPKRMLKDREGNFADTYDMSLPEKDASGLTDNNVYVYYEDGDDIVVTNRTGISAAESGYFEICYNTSEDSWEYADYKKQASSDTFTASVTLGTQSMEASAKPVYINTAAEVTSTLKYWPDRYETWQDSWGTEPSDSSDYIYLVWEIRTKIEATSGYNFTLTDTFPEGEVVGYKFQGESTFSPEHTLENQTASYPYGRYDYVLTRLPISTYGYDKVTSFAVTNHIDATADPIDQQDEDSTRSSEKEYKWERPVFTAPGGKIQSYKYGMDFNGQDVESSEQLSVFGDQVRPFYKGTSSTMGDFRYRTYVDGHPYPWTLESNADPTDPESYGKVPVTYQLTDEKVSLGEDTALRDADYDFTELKIRAYYSDADYNSEECEFESKKADLSNDLIEIYVRQENGEYVEAATYRPADQSFDIIRSDLVSDSGSSTLALNGNIKGYRLVTSNAHYYTYMGCYPKIRLNATETVKDYVADHLDRGSVTNSETSVVTTSSGSEIVTLNRSGTDYFTSQTNVSTLKKSIQSYKNDTINKSATVKWNVAFDEQTVKQDGYIYQKSGTFYDLLPLGSYYCKDSAIVYADDSVLNSGDYTITVEDNYRDTGRQMLKIQVKKGAARNYMLTYESSHSWDSLKDFKKDMLNSVAYETGNDDLDDGYPDNGGINTDTREEIISETEEMSDLDPDTDAKKFVYAEKALSLNVPTAASIGLYKKVKSAEDSEYSAATTVHQNEIYSYYVRFATSQTAQAKNLILYDALEEYQTEDGDKSDWQGSLVSIDTSYLKKLGIDPVVYYSTAVTDVSGETDTLDPSKWSSTAPSDLSKVTAIAVDIRRKTDGTEYIMQPGKSASIKIYMRSPEGESASMEELQNPKAYNNIYLYSTVTTDTAETIELIHQDYTAVNYRIAGSFELLKVDSTDHDKKISGIKFQLKGTSFYGTDVDMVETTGESGEVSFENVEKGTYTLQEVDGVADYLQDHTMRTVTVDKNGEVTIDGLSQNSDKQFVVENRPRIHGDLVFDKADSVTGRTLSGTTFCLEGTSDYGNDVLMYESSDSNGRVAFADVEKGTYTLTETDAADGYILPKDKTWKVTCDSEGNLSIAGVSMDQSGNYCIANESYHSFRIYKKGSIDGLPVSGAVFALTGTSDYGHTIEVEKTTEDSGYAVFSSLEPGAYILQETEAPSGYRLDRTKHAVIIQNDGTVTIDGETVTESDPYTVVDQQTSQEEVVVTKKWNDGLTGEAADQRDYPNIHIASYDSSAETLSKTASAKITAAHTMTMNDVTVTATGTWGTCDWKLYSDGRLVIGGGNTSDSSLLSVLGKAKAGKVTSIETVGTVDFTNSDSAFGELPHVTAINLEGSTLKKTKTSLYWFFHECPELEEVTGLDNWDVSGVDNMMFVFSDDNKLKTVDGIQNWNTGKVEQMNGLFGNCYSLSQETLEKLSDWDVSNVRTMGYEDKNGGGGFRDDCGTFGNCRSLTSLEPLRNWKTGNVELFSSTFAGCTGITDLSPIAGWSTDSVISTQHMFQNCTNLTRADLSTWKMSNVRTTSMFSNDRQLSWLKLGTNSRLTDSGLVTPSGSLYTGKWTKWNQYNKADAIPVSQLQSRYPGTGGESAVWVWQKDPDYQKYDQEYQSDDGVLTDSTGAVTHNIYQPEEDDASKIDTFVDSQGNRTGYWTKVSDDTWTYTFFVFDADVSWKVWEDPMDGYQTDYTENNPLTIQTGHDEAVVTNSTGTEEGYGSLKIEKQLQISDADGNTVEPGNEEKAKHFIFKVTLTDQDNQPLTGTAIYGNTVFVDGTASVAVSVSTPALIEEIPAGYHYSIEEIEDSAYELEEISNQTGVIEKQKTASAVAVNKGEYSEDDPQYLIIHKTCNDTDVPFTFHVRLTGLTPQRLISFEIYDSNSYNKASSYAEADSSGKADLTFTLNGGWYAVINNLNSGSQYQATEDKNDYTASYQVTSSSIGSTESQTVADTGANEEIQKDLTTDVNTITSGISDTVNFTNTKPAFEVEFSKRDNQEGFVEGAVLQVLDQDGSVLKEWTTAAGETEKVSLEAGTYTLHELSAPAGYGKAADISFTISADGTISGNPQRLITMIDEKNMTDVEFNKTDGVNEIAGAVLRLQVIDENNVPVDVSTWTTDGSSHVESLQFGKTYILHEDTAPAGYAYANDIEIVVDSSGKVTINGEETAVCTMIDKKLAELPSSGSPDGRTKLLVCGIGFVICAWILISDRRKKTGRV